MSKKPTIFFAEPNFFPPLPFFYGLLNSDVWVCLDHVRFWPRSYMQKCRLRSLTGIQNLMVTVKRPCSKPICQMVINNMHPWQKQLLNAVKHSYSNAPFFKTYYSAFEYHINSPNILIETLNVQTTLWIANTLGKHVPIIFTQNSYMSYPKAETHDLIEKKLNGIIFDEEFKHPYYKQTLEPFEPDLSVLDALFCVGANELKALLTKK